MTRDLCRGAAWFVGAALLFVRPEATLRAADWPMWRHDAARGAASDEELAEELHLQWVLELSTPRPAWPSSQEKLQFDTHYEPVLAGGKLFVPSMVADRVTAHDSRTGEELWRFYADGPVRFAPLHWRGKVYFVSDDSYLYCLDARDGSLLWKFRGGPSESKVLGNERLISSWPARGAPVLFDGTIYFAASIWPFMGVFVQALNAETGEVVWTNSGSGSTYLVQQHNDPAFAGVAPQGYMAATEDHLVVSGGRTMPAIFDRKTGEFLHFDVGSRAMGSKGGGGYAVIAGENFYLNQGPKNQGAMYRFDTGKFVTSVGAAVLSKYALIGLSERFGRQTVRGYRPGWRLTEFTDRRGKKQKRAVAISSWSATLEERLEQLFIKSGPRLYCRGPKNSVVAVDLPSLDRGARISWRTRLPDRPLAMISGDGRLFVSTDLGRIYCFGAEDRGVDLPTGETGVLVPRGSSWKFADDGTDLGTSWRQPSYDDSEWSVGPAQLGYGDGDEATRLSFGGDPKKKPVTVYFRRAFQVAEGSRFTELKLSTLVDDGGVVYLNGQEVARHFLPEGEIGSDTLAESGTDEKTYESVTLPGDALRTGENTLAVEVHQRRRDSSDLSFDLELSGELAGRRSQLPVVEDRWTEVARAILQEKGLREKGLAGDGKGRDGSARDGYCLALGLGSGRLVEELARLSRLHVVVVERDAAKIDAFRRRIDDAGVYGVRIAAIAGDPRSLELPPYAVDLLVSEEPRAAGFGEGESFARRAFKLLRPYSGLAVFAASREEQRDFEVAVRRARLDGGSARRSGRFALLERTAPPSGSGDWTHQYADSSNSVVSKDSVVRAPLGLLWFGGPPNDQVLPRHGHGPTPQVCRGRLFIEGRHMMRALDIYTGRLLWQRELKDLGKYYDYTGHEPGANAIGSNYVSLADGVYVVHGKKCLHLDPATGETLRELVLPAADDEAEPPEWGYIGAWGDYLLAGARPVDYSSPYLTAREIAGLKDPVIQEALKIMKTWKGFEPLERRQKEDDKSFLRANVNKLLAEEGFLERIPAEVRKKAKAEKDEDQLLDYLEDLPGRRPTDWVALAIKRQLLSRYYKLPGYKRQEPGTFGSERRVGSKQLIALKRQSGEPLWQFEGHHQFRHNAVAAGNGWVFCVDRLPDAVAERHRRRGVETSGESRLVALDLGTGEILWSTSRRVFGTWLGYSEEHDVLLQAGSKGRDRMRDEVGQGMVAYRGATGEVLWENDLKYQGPCLLLADTVITQAPGFALDIHTGARKMRRHPLSGEPVAWGYRRKYGCNSAIGSRRLLTFRSAAAGYYDLAGDGGTGNLGGFRSGCTSNLIPAGGILCAPDYSRTCTCAYQNQASLALVHAPDAEMWTFNHFPHDGRPVRRVGINFGAPGDRRDADGTLWLDYPSVGGESPDIPVEIVRDPDGAAGSGDGKDADGKKLRTVRYHASAIEAADLDWVGASAVELSGEVALKLISPHRVEVTNEFPDGLPLSAANATVSTRVPADRVPQSGRLNRTSLSKGTAESDLQAVVKGYAPLGSPSLTVEFWVSTGHDIDYVDARYVGKDKKSQGFVIDNRALRVRYFVADAERKKSAPEARLESDEKIPADRWVHVAFTYDAPSGTAKLYRDGELLDSHDGPDDRPLWWDTRTPGLVIGRGAGESTYLDELRISRGALEPIQFLRSTELPAEDESVIGYWRMESAKGATQSRTGRVYTVRLVFAELEDVLVGERVFDVRIQGRRRLRDFDIVREAGGPRRLVIKEFDNIAVEDFLRIELQPRSEKKPLLGGVQVVAKSKSF